MNHPFRSIQGWQNVDTASHKCQPDPNPSLALHRLAHANYFRLNCYRHPFLNPGTDTFTLGCQFDDLWEIYRFDHLFRILMLDAIERCEISFRTQWAYTLAHQHGPQSYENPAIHRDPAEHKKTLSKSGKQEIRKTPYRKPW